MSRETMLLVFLLTVPDIAQAMPHGCSALGASGRDLWIIAADQEPRHVLRAERDIAVGSWSPNGREIAFHVVRATTDLPTEAFIADLGGRIIGRFQIDKGQSDGGLRHIEGIEWRGERILVTLGNRGPNGGYMDVWRLSEDHTGAAKVLRVGTLGGSCAVSPSMQYVACRGGGKIKIFNTSAPADENGVVDDLRFFETPTSGDPDEPSERVEGGLAWGSDGLSVYGVRSLDGKRVLTRIEKNPVAAEGWSVTDQDLVGIDSPVRSIEADASGGLLLSDGRRVFRVEAEPETPRSGVVARVVSAAELRRPGAVEVSTERGKLRLEVLDTYCEERNPR